MKYSWVGAWNGTRESRRRIWAALVAVGLLSWVAGCGEGEGGAAAKGTTTYPTPARTSRVDVAVAESARTPAPAFGGTALLSVIQSDLTPATLWQSRADTVRFFAGMQASGLGGPSFLAYSSPTGIATLQLGGEFEGAGLRENWLLVGFPGAEGWSDWDSPWAVFLQRRPARVALSTNGLEVVFAGEAGQWSMLPLYGAYRPPQKGHEVLAKAGLKEKGMLTWEWPLVVARDPLTRLRYWGGATRRFPLDREGGVRVESAVGRVTLKESFTWLEVPDEWKTRPIEVAPVRPALGLSIIKGQSFPAEFSQAPFDFEMPTVFGPYFGIPNSAAYEVWFPFLHYVEETEAVLKEADRGASAPVQAALEQIRKLAGEEMVRLGGVGGAGFDGALDTQLFRDVEILARALPYCDPAVRSNAWNRLGGLFRNLVLAPGRFVERTEVGGKRVDYRAAGRGGDHAIGLESGLLESVWAYAHFSGDHALVQERWMWLRRWFSGAASVTWPGMGGEGSVAMGGQASAAIAFCRLAWLAGDLEAYELGCGRVARELSLENGRLRGARWWREQQPWSLMQVIPEGALLAGLQTGRAGWGLTEAGTGAGSDGAWFRSRWAGFADPDVARFFRDHGAAEVRRELGGLRATLASGRASRESADMLGELGRLEAWLRPWSPTNLTDAVKAGGMTTGHREQLIQALTVLRLVKKPGIERLIDSGILGRGRADRFETEADAEPVLIQRIQAVPGPGGAATWPRVVFLGGKTPSGDAWNVGEVRVGGGDLPGRIVRVRLNPHAVRYDVSAVDSAERR